MSDLQMLKDELMKDSEFAEEYEKIQPELDATRAILNAGKDGKMDRITFDFETGEIIFDTDGQKGTELDPDLKDKRAAILAAAGFDTIPTEELRSELDQLFADLGFGVLCARPEDKD